MVCDTEGTLPPDIDIALSGQSHDVAERVEKAQDEMTQRFLLGQLDCATTCERKQKEEEAYRER